MARTPLRPPRGTRAQIDAAAAAGTLVLWEVFEISDEGRLAFATATNAYRVVPLEDTTPRLSSAGGTVTGRLDLQPGDLGTNNGAANFANRNVWKVAQTAAMTLTVSNLVDGNDGQVNLTYTAGALSFSGVTRWVVGEDEVSVNFTDTTVGSTGLVAGARYQFVFSNIGGTITGRVARVL